MIRRSARSTAVLLLAVLPALAAGPGPAGGKGPVPRGNCAVCGMYVANFPDWAAVATFKDGTQAWFDGPKDLFTFLFDPGRYTARRKGSDIASIQVKDYYGLKHIDGRSAWYVLGSDVLGPMGKELVPFRTESAARDFLKDHRGQKVLAFHEITAVTLAGLQ